MESSKIQEISMMAKNSPLCLLGTGKHCIQYSMTYSWSFVQNAHHGNLRVQPCYATHPPSPEIWPYQWIIDHHASLKTSKKGPFFLGRSGIGVVYP